MQSGLLAAQTQANVLLRLVVDEGELQRFINKGPAAAHSHLLFTEMLLDRNSKTALSRAKASTL